MIATAMLPRREQVRRRIRCHAEMPDEAKILSGFIEVFFLVAGCALRTVGWVSELPADFVLCTRAYHNLPCEVYKFPKDWVTKE